MGKKLVVTFIVVVVVGLLGYLLIRYYPKTQTNNNTPVAGNSVTIKSFAFSPSNLSVKVGDTVTWTNEDNAAHAIKSDTFNSNDLRNGDRFTHTFDNAGTFSYSCSIHPSMTGQIVVQ